MKTIICFLNFFVIICSVNLDSSVGEYPAKSDDSFVFRPGVIVSPQQNALYLMTPNGSIDAVNLLSGNVIWSVADGAKPLALAKKILVTQAELQKKSNILKIVALDSEKEGQRIWTTEILLPLKVKALIDDGMESYFRVMAWYENNKVNLSWVYVEKGISGMDISGVQNSEKLTKGLVLINLETGQSKVINDNLKPPISMPMPDIPHPGTQIFDDFTVRYLSADSRHFLASKLKQANERDESQLIYQWKIILCSNQKDVLDLPHHLPAAWFFFYKPYLYYEFQGVYNQTNEGLIVEPPGIIAMDTKTGIELWRLHYRDIKYRGLYPPPPP